MKRDRLYSPKVIKDMLKRFGFSFSKGLGQNFLIDGNIVRNIRKSANISKEDNVLEIGPGFGTLTEELLLHAKKVVAIEIDERLLEVLDYSLEDFDNFKLIHGDALKVDLQKIVEEEFNGESFKLVANLPYYITTPIISRFIEEDLPVESLTVMVQKEVAERMVASKGSKTYGSLSLFLQYYSDPKLVVKAPKSVFMPQPKIDSMVVHMDLKERENVLDKDLFFGLVHGGFNQRRKNILNSFTSNKELNLTKDQLKLILEKLGIDSKKRAEDLALEDFINISNEICLSRKNQGILE